MTAEKRMAKDRRCSDCVAARRRALVRKPTHPKKNRAFNFDIRRDHSLTHALNDAMLTVGLDASLASESSPPSPTAASLLDDDDVAMADGDILVDSSDDSAPAAAAASAAPAAAPWKLAEPLPLSTSSAPLEHFINDFLSCFILYGFCLIRAIHSFMSESTSAEG